MCTVVSAVFLFGSNPKKYLSLEEDLTFHIFIGIHPSYLGLKLLYYHLCSVEESLTMNVCHLPFNRPFIIIVKT